MLVKFAIEFDEFYFCGGLVRANRVDISFATAMQPYGVTIPVPECKTHNQKGRCFIRIHHNHPILKMAGQTRLHQLLRTLLYEMCHAIILIYAYPSHRSFSDHVLLEGLKGHGRAWRELFNSVAIKAEKFFGIQICRVNDLYVGLRSECEQLTELIESPHFNPWGY